MREENGHAQGAQPLAELFDGLPGLAEDEPLLAAMESRDDRGHVVEAADIVELDVTWRGTDVTWRGTAYGQLSGYVGGDDLRGPGIARRAQSAPRIGWH